MRIEDALHTFVNYQDTQSRNFYQRVEDSSRRVPFQLIGCHHAGKSHLVYWTCKQRNLLYCHVTYPDVLQQDDPDDFIKHLLDVVVGAESIALQEGVVLPAPHQNRDANIFTRYLTRILATQSVVFVFSFRNAKKPIYQNIDRWLREALSQVEDTQKHQIHLVYTAWSHAKPFGNVLPQASRFAGPVQEKPTTSNFPNIALPSDSGPGSEHIPCPVTSGKAYEIFCAALYPQLPEFITSEILAEWCGGHLGSILFLAKAVNNHLDETSQTLPITERIKICIRSYDPGGNFSENLRCSVGYSLKERKIPGNISPELHGLCTLNGKYIRLLEYGAQPYGLGDDVGYFNHLRKLTVRISTIDSEGTPIFTSGILFKYESYWYVLTCNHCVSNEEFDETTITLFDESVDKAFVICKTGADRTINDMALLGIKPNSVTTNYINSLNLDFPKLHNVNLTNPIDCFSYGYGTLAEGNDQVRRGKWGIEKLGGFYSVDMRVTTGDSGSPIWHWDQFEFQISGMVVNFFGPGQEARVIKANILYNFVQKSLQNSVEMANLNQWRNQ